MALESSPWPLRLAGHFDPVLPPPGLWPSPYGGHVLPPPLPEPEFLGRSLPHSPLEWTVAQPPSLEESQAVEPVVELATGPPRKDKSPSLTLHVPRTCRLPHNNHTPPLCSQKLYDNPPHWKYRLTSIKRRAFHALVL